MLSEEQTSFITKYQAWAESAARRLFWNPLAVLAQWADESGWGTSALVRVNNLGGIELPGGRGFAAYRDMPSFVAAYCQIMENDTPVLKQNPVPQDPKDVLATSDYNPNHPTYEDTISEIWNELKVNYPNLAVNFNRPQPTPQVSDLTKVIAEMQATIQQLQAEVAQLKMQG